VRGEGVGCVGAAPFWHGATTDTETLDLQRPIIDTHELEMAKEASSQRLVGLAERGRLHYDKALSFMYVRNMASPSPPLELNFRLTTFFTHPQNLHTDLHEHPGTGPVVRDQQGRVLGDGVGSRRGALQKTTGHHAEPSQVDGRDL
jgi:hypothetical protein